MCNVFVSFFKNKFFYAHKQVLKPWLKNIDPKKVCRPWYKRYSFTETMCVCVCDIWTFKITIFCRPQTYRSVVVCSVLLRKINTIIGN